MSTLLVVDDVPANLAMLIDAATDAGHRVLLADSGEHALRLVERATPDLILLDVMMPGIGGLETCRRLKRLPQTSNTPVIFLTALGDVVDKVAGLEAGAVDYVTKPLQPLEVLARVRVHLELRALRAELAARNAELEIAIRRREDAERALRHTLDRAVLVATLDGQILFASQRATRIIEEHFGVGHDALLPLPLFQQFAESPARAAQTIATAAGQLRVRRFAELGESECATLLLEEIGISGASRLARLGLTPREAEVLFWVAEGKSNAEIALILANTAGTVKKQVQSILDKLGLENRLIAARHARELLDGSALHHG